MAWGSGCELAVSMSENTSPVAPSAGCGFSRLTSTSSSFRPFLIHGWRCISAMVALCSTLGVRMRLRQVDGVLAEVRRVGELGLDDLAEEVHHADLVERQVAGQQDVQDDAGAPHVRRLAVVALVHQHLGRHVVGRAARGVEEVERRHLRPRFAHRAAAVLRLDGQLARAEAEVGDLERALVVQEEVLGLEVAVAHAIHVAVRQAADELAEVLARAARAVLLQLALLHDDVEQLAALHELQHQVDGGGAGQHLLELDDVGVLERLHDGDLLLDLLAHLRGADLGLVHHLQRHALARLAVLRQLHLAERALPQLLPQDVLATRAGPERAGVRPERHCRRRRTEEGWRRWGRGGGSESRWARERACGVRWRDCACAVMKHCSEQYSCTCCWCTGHTGMGHENVHTVIPVDASGTVRTHLRRTPRADGVLLGDRTRHRWTA